MSKAMENYLKKRKIIVGSAKKLFLGHGYAATSMDKVAEKAGVTKQTVYRYFSSKAELFKATLEAVIGGDKRTYVFGNDDIQTELTAFGIFFLRLHMERERLDVIRLLVAEGCKDRELSQTFYENGPKIYGIGTIVPFLRKRMPDIGDVTFLGSLFLEMLLAVRMPVLLGINDPPSDDEMGSHVTKVVHFFLAGCQNGAFDRGTADDGSVPPAGRFLK